MLLELRNIYKSFGEKEVLKGISFSAKSLDDGELLITLSSPEEKNPVMRRLTEKYDIDGIKVFEPSLNDIFVEYAGERE